MDYLTVIMVGAAVLVLFFLILTVARIVKAKRSAA